MTQVRYDVAISFADEDRDVAEEIATSLLARGYRVFYDRFEQHALLGEDLGGYLPDVYGERSRYCVVIVSGHYADKVWTRLEFRSAIAGALFGGARDAFVLPLRLDDTKLSGLQSTVGYLDLRVLEVGEAVDLLVRKIGPPADAVDGDSSAIAGIDETVALCRAHIRTGMSVRALREFRELLRRRITFVRPREAQQLVAGMIAELDLAVRVHRDKAQRDTSGLVDAAVTRVEAAVRALADMSDRPAPDMPTKSRRTWPVLLAAGGVLAFGGGALLVTDGLGVFAAEPSPAPSPAPVTSAPPSSTGATASPPASTGTVSSPAALPPFVKSVASTSNPLPTPTPQARMISHGQDFLVPTDGLDLDAGSKGYQDDPGMDISPSKDGSLINAMSHGKPRMALVTSQAVTGPGLCDTVPADAWRQQLLGLYQMKVGDRICVRTDRGNYGVLTLRAVPSADSVNLDVDYVAWGR